jgi:predicted Zn-dependent peptidase
VPATVRRSVLPGGLRVVTEQVPGMRSAAFGIWVAVGSRDERPSIHGASHFLEHLLFKGTKRRDALEISSVMDAVGGEMNAFTAKEYTCYYARVLDEDLPLAVDVLSDMVLSSLVLAEDVEVERGVILEEIAMHDDDPADAVHDAFAGALFGDSPLGRPVIGTVDSIEGLSRTAIAGFYRRRYALPQMVVAAAGGVEHERLLELVQAAFGDRLTGDAAPGAAAAGRPQGAVVLAGVAQRAAQRADQPGARHDGAAPRRPAALRPVGAVAARGRRHVEPAVPVGARGARPGVLRLQLHRRARRHRPFGVYAGCAPGQGRQGAGPGRAELAQVAEQGVRTRRSAGRRATCAGRWCSASRTPARG